MSIHLKQRKSKTGLSFKFKVYEHPIDYKIKEVFVGHNTIFSLLGSVVGGILVGRSLWEYSKIYLGLPYTILIGLIIFAISGIVLHRFHR